MHCQTRKAWHGVPSPPSLSGNAHACWQAKRCSPLISSLEPPQLAFAAVLEGKGDGGRPLPPSLVQWHTDLHPLLLFKQALGLPILLPSQVQPGADEQAGGKAAILAQLSQATWLLSHLRQLAGNGAPCPHLAMHRCCRGWVFPDTSLCPTSGTTNTLYLHLADYRKFLDPLLSLNGKCNHQLIP